MHEFFGHPRSSDSRKLGRLFTALLTLSGCTPEGPAMESVADWVVSGQPTVRIGDDLPAGHEFAGIVSARRLPDGRFLVANAGALELGLFDSTGHFVRSIGRKGSGPGEFVATVNLYAATADSLAVYDGGNLRWSVFSPALAVARTFPTSEPGSPHPVWVHRGALISQASLQQAPAWILPILDSLRAADPEVTRLIEGRIDDAGALWLRSGKRPTEWDVYVGPGAPVGRALLPPGLNVVQIGRDFVLGVLADSLGLETVALYRLARGVAGTPEAIDSIAQTPAHPGPARPETADPALRAEFASGIMTAQEAYYSNHGAYTSRADSLLYSFDPPARLFLLYGDNRHWAGIVVRLKTYATCGVSVGFPAPAGWEDGGPLCDQ